MTVHFAEEELNLGHLCETMLEFRLNVTESKYSFHMRIMEIPNTMSLFLTVRSSKPSKFTVMFVVKVQKVKHYIFLMLAIRTKITADKIVLSYEKS